MAEKTRQGILGKANQSARTAIRLMFRPKDRRTPPKYKRRFVRLSRSECAKTHMRCSVQDTIAPPNIPTMVAKTLYTLVAHIKKEKTVKSVAVANIETIVYLIFTSQRN